MSPLRFQIISDLHLETPLMSPSYDHYSKPENFPIHAPNLFLLGDIGLTNHPQLFTFLTTLLSAHTSLQIFYVMGNHEPYHTTLEDSIARLSEFERDIKEKYSNQQRFYFLNRTRVDIDERVTILGCTLWTHIPDHAAHDCTTLLKDFNEQHGICERSVQSHNSDHLLDLQFLNHQVQSITSESSEREIIILTHHSPTIDARANHPRHDKSSTNDGFRTDLSGEVCWTNMAVRMWGWGHTHFNCQFWDDGDEVDVDAGADDVDVGGNREWDKNGTRERKRQVQKRRKLVIANQKGYGMKDINVIVIEAEEGEQGWKVVMGAKESQDLRNGKKEGEIEYFSKHVAQVKGENEEKTDRAASTSESQRPKVIGT
jgi:hypothetical protein